VKLGLPKNLEQKRIRATRGGVSPLVAPLRQQEQPTVRATLPEAQSAAHARSSKGVRHAASGVQVPAMQNGNVPLPFVINRLAQV
jgi:hypothetical protein